MSDNFFNYMQLMCNNNDNNNDDVISISSTEDAENEAIWISSDSEEEEEIGAYTPPVPISWSRPGWGFEASDYETDECGFEYEPLSWHVPTIDGDADAIIQPINASGNVLELEGDDIFCVQDDGDADGDILPAFNDVIVDEILMQIDVLPINEGNISPLLDANEYDLMINQLIEFDDAWGVFIDAANDANNYFA